MHNGSTTDALAEADLRARIFKHLDEGAAEFIHIKWIPSHLNVTSRAASKFKYMQGGIIDQDDINGNVGADELANQGWEKHLDISPLTVMSEDMMQVTTMVQNMQLHIWSSYVDSASVDVKRADEADTAIIKNINDTAKQEACIFPLVVVAGRHCGAGCRLWHPAPVLAWHHVGARYQILAIFPALFP